MTINYTPEEITEILNDYFSGITHKQYIGARYVPIFGRKNEESIIWDNTGTYEPLTIVLYQGNSYTSRQYVPIGVEITNEKYWALTGNYNAQVEAYRQEVLRVSQDVEDIENNMPYKEFAFETVADMQAYEDLFVGAICHTNGFYTSGDGGAAFYKITATGTANGMDVIACGDLFANLVYDKRVRAAQIGLKNDNQTDNASTLVDFINNCGGNIDIVFERGCYRFSPVDIPHDNVSFIGSESFYPIGSSGGQAIHTENLMQNAEAGAGTFFAPYRNQDYVFSGDNLRNITFKNITFTSVKKLSTYTDSISDFYYLEDAAIFMNCISMSNFENVSFIGIYGSCVKSDNSWEIRFDNLEVRLIYPYGVPINRGCFEFVSTNNHINNSAWKFSNVNIENVICHWFLFDGANTRNMSFSNLQGEINGLGLTEQTTYNTANSPAVDLTTSLSVFAIKNLCKYTNLVVESLIIDNLGYMGYTLNGTLYVPKNIINCYDDSCFDLSIGQISLAQSYANCFACYTTTETIGKNKKLAIGSILSPRNNEELHILKGTLSSLKCPQLSTANSGANLLFNYPIDFMPTAYNRVVASSPYEMTPRAFSSTSRHVHDVVKMTPNLNNINNASTSWREALHFPTFGKSHIMVIANSNSNLTVGVFNGTSYSEVTTGVTVTKTTSNTFDFYEVEIDSSIQKNYNFFGVLGDGTNTDYIYDVVIR